MRLKIKPKRPSSSSNSSCESKEEVTSKEGNENPNHGMDAAGSCLVLCLQEINSSFHPLLPILISKVNLVNLSLSNASTNCHLDSTLFNNSNARAPGHSNTNTILLRSTIIKRVQPDSQKSSFTLHWGRKNDISYFYVKAALILTQFKKNRACTAN